MTTIIDHSSGDTVHLSRRRFLQSSALGAAGLIIGVHLPGLARAQSGAANVIQGDNLSGGFAPNAFVRIAPDDTVTVLIKHIEFGQGPYTGLATLVAEELDADWAQMRAESAPADAEVYKNFAFGVQGTGGSTAMKNSYMQMRQAGAAARAMLVAAAAEDWGVPASEISVEKGVVKHSGGGHSARFGELAEKAAGMKAPQEPKLKSPEQFTLIGTDLPKLDTASKTNGQAQFTLDIYQDNMLTVVVAHPPLFGATAATLDDSGARQVKGVVDVKIIPQGVAVFADDTWSALQGRKALQIRWDTSAAETRSSAQIIEGFRAAAGKPGDMATDRGDTKAALDKAKKTLEAEYVFPFLAHAPMEPLDAVVVVNDDGAEAWFGSQIQTLDQGTMAKTLGLEPGKIKIHTQLAGGSFGRRAQPDAGFAAEAAEVAKIHKGRPVKLVWTREDDIRGGRYRPLVVHKLSGGLDEQGSHIAAWQHVVATQSIMKGSPFEGMMKGPIDPTSVEGANDMPYAIPALQVSLHTMQTGVPILWWRSVGHTHTAFVVETFIDELLEAAGQDPVEGRLALLKDAPREAGVLKAVAELAGWGGDVPEGRARGVAVHKSFDTYVAEIAEVSAGADGLPRVHKVWCAVDCGVAVNPNIIRAQMEGGIGYGLGAALFDEITLDEGGMVTQRNFDSYRSIRINEMPEIEVAIVKSAEEPSGVGEPGVPPAAPAVANAWRKLTGKAVRRLPFTTTS
jgi:isoquinoline 1-oxidoreductase beta subunit